MLRTQLSVPLLLLCFSTAHAGPLHLVAHPAEQAHAPFAVSEAQPPSAEGLRKAKPWGGLRFRKGAGLEVRQQLSFGERELIVGVKGPLMKKKRLGLAFEVRF